MDMMIKDFTSLDYIVDSQANWGTGDGHHLCLDDIDSDVDIFANLSFFANLGCAQVILKFVWLFCQLAIADDDIFIENLLLMTSWPTSQNITLLASYLVKLRALL